MTFTNSVGCAHLAPVIDPSVLRPTILANVHNRNIANDLAMIHLFETMMLFAHDCVVVGEPVWGKWSRRLARSIKDP